MQQRVTVRDVAAYILHRDGAMSTFKLQKLCYYAQAWHATLYDTPLFRERIEAWVNGPVSPELYRQHRGRYTVKDGEIKGHPERIRGHQKSVVDQVLDIYGPLTPVQLVDRTHAEKPWRDAREGIGPRTRGSSEITVEAMADYYGRLLPSDG